MGRDHILKHCMESLESQTFKDYETILCQKEGNLVEFKDKGLRQAKGEITIWLDDDVYCGKYMLEEILKLFKNKSIVGVTGNTTVPFNYRKNRDILNDSWWNFLYNQLFLDGEHLIPGKISRCGASTLGANYTTKESMIQRDVDFLEPCMFAIRTKEVLDVGGFDYGYTGVAEWCDVDLCYRIKQRTGKRLVYSPEVRCLHMPIKDKVIYEKRFETKSRYANYLRFSKRWVKPNFKHYVYRMFLKTYYFLKGRRMI